MERQKFNIDELLTTGEFAIQVHRSVDTIRRWHRSGKFTPAVIDCRGGRMTRYYSKEQVREVKELLKNNAI